MLGAVFGDIVGSVYEHHNTKSTDFPLENALWLTTDPQHRPETLVSCMRELGNRYYWAGYGGNFRRWLRTEHPEPYNSWGNGSAMRVSPVGLYAATIDEALRLAEVSAAVTHNHPEGIKGAQAVAVAVLLNRIHGDRPDVRQMVKHEN